MFKRLWKHIINSSRDRQALADQKQAWEDHNLPDDPRLRNLLKAIYELQLLKRAQPPVLKGCTREQLVQIQEEQQVTRLPELYQKLMLIMGEKGLYIFFPADAWVACSLVGSNKEIVLEMMAEGNNIPELPSDAFIFSGVFIYGFEFFLTDNEEDNPPIYRYTAGSEAFKKISDTLSSYLYEIVDTEIKAFKGKP